MEVGQAAAWRVWQKELAADMAEGGGGRGVVWERENEGSKRVVEDEW